MARIAGALGKLREQLQTACPRVPKDEFGWIASPEHSAQNPNSDHEPDGRGIVHALDIPHYPELGLDCAALFTHFRTVAKDRRIKYAIFNLKIFGDEGYARRNGRQAWTLYNASNHTEHMHVSVNIAGEDDALPWDIGPIADEAPDQPPPVMRPLLKKGSTGELVRQVQAALMTDGIFGAETESAVRRFQREQGDLIVDGIVGPATWRRLEPLLGEAPPVELGEWQTNIEATQFGGSGDEQPVAYPDVANGWPDRLGVSLPDRFEGTRPKVEVKNLANGKTIMCPIVDVGPWMATDDYWQTGARPIAETCHNNGTPLPSGPNEGIVPTNKAGIDLTPAADEAIGLNGKGYVDWRLIT